MTAPMTSREAPSDYSDLVAKLHEQAEWYADGHGPLHAAAANAIDHLMTLIRLMAPGAAQAPGEQERLAHQISRGTLFLRLPDPPRPSTELKEAEKQMIVAGLMAPRSSAQTAPPDEDHPDCVTDREHELYDALMGLSSAVTARQGWSKWVQGGVQIAPIVHKALRLNASPVASTDSAIPKSALAATPEEIAASDTVVGSVTSKDRA